MNIQIFCKQETSDIQRISMETAFYTQHLWFHAGYN